MRLCLHSDMQTCIHNGYSGQNFSVRLTQKLNKGHETDKQRQTIFLSLLRKSQILLQEQVISPKKFNYMSFFFHGVKNSSRKGHFGQRVITRIGNALLLWFEELSIRTKRVRLISWGVFSKCYFQCYVICEM